MEGIRARLLTAALLAGAVALIVVVAVLAREESDEETLRLELRGTDLVAYVKADANVLGTTDGRRSVTLECLDRSGTTVVRGKHRWPFSDTDGGTLDPHVHETVPGSAARDIERCRLGGTRGPLEGQVAPAA